MSFLKQDEVKNLSMIYFMEDYGATSIERIGDSTLVRGESDRPWVYISSPDPAELNLVVERLTADDVCFAAIEDWMVPVLTRDRPVLWMLSMVRFILRRCPPVLPGKTGAPVMRLTEDDAQFIYDNSLYKEFTSPEYIRERIRKGKSAGIHVAGSLVAWVTTHDDGSIGIMHVLDAYRRKGYARVLTLDVINQVYAQGRIPYLHIEDSNTGAMSVVASLGFERDRLVHWFEIGQGRTE